MKKLLIAAVAGSFALFAPATSEAQVMTWPGSSVGISPFSQSYNYLTSPYRSGQYYSRYGYDRGYGAYYGPKSHWESSGRDRYYRRSYKSSKYDHRDRYDRRGRDSHWDRDGRWDRSDRHRGSSHGGWRR